MCFVIFVTRIQQRVCDDTSCCRPRVNQYLQIGNAMKGSWKYLPEYELHYLIYDSFHEVAVGLHYIHHETDIPIIMALGETEDAHNEMLELLLEDEEVVAVENDALALMLFRNCKLGEELPKEYYHATARVLAPAYKERYVEGQGK